MHCQANSRMGTHRSDLQSFHSKLFSSQFYSCEQLKQFAAATLCQNEKNNLPSATPHRSFEDRTYCKTECLVLDSLLANCFFSFSESESERHVCISSDTWNSDISAQGLAFDRLFCIMYHIRAFSELRPPGEQYCLQFHAAVFRDHPHLLRVGLVGQIHHRFDGEAYLHRFHCTCIL